MIPERWHEIKNKLDAVLELEPAQRSAYLDEISTADPELRHELESLIASHEEAGTDFLNNGVRFNFVRHFRYHSLVNMWIELLAH
jgi:hypothetical protein